MRVELTLAEEPPMNTFTLFVSFRNGVGNFISIPIEFTKESAQLYKGYATNQGKDRLEWLNKTGNRWYWDHMYLENKYLSTEFAVKRILVEVRYWTGMGAPWSSLAGGSVWEYLGREEKINLDDLRWGVLIEEAGLTTGEYWDLPEYLQLMIMDLGKTGTDGNHFPWMKNPKYNVGESNLCSEFVTWYLYKAGVKLELPSGTFDFRDVESTDEVIDAFDEVNLLYDYNGLTGEWINTQTSENYIPQTGDYLIRRENQSEGIAKHSMMILEYNSDDNKAKVIDGPWWVKLYHLNIHKKTIDENHEYCVGKLN